MSNAARLLPAGLGEAQADVFPLRERLRFRDSFGLALLELRARSGAFQQLPKGPWALFIGIAVHWQGNAEAWPSQVTLARFNGWSPRAVRDQAQMLERGGFIRVRRERRADGSERIYYAPGLVTLAALAEFVERFPRERAKALQPEALRATPTAVRPPEAIAAAPPAEASMEPRDQDQIELSSSCEANGTNETGSGPPEEERLVVTKDDEEIGRRALAERMRRKHPLRLAPRWFDRSELAMVAVCSAALEGNSETKLLSHHDAIAGAFLASKNGPPTVRFVWQKLDHFFDHVDRGRRRRLAEERAAQLRAQKGEITPRPVRLHPPAIPCDQMDADLERLFGPGWKTHVPR